ncbi:MAG: hypothetical protein CXR31_12215 [Geobacter sp.]|nr:MAG: hypothetical protein CXR31_12215 [Geobacter sp.]
MKLIPAGDYYLWFCEWCDSQNNTLWTRMDAHHLTCGVCSRQEDLWRVISASPGTMCGTNSMAFPFL